MRLFIAIATFSSLLDVVALRALAAPGDRVRVLTDPYARSEGHAQRLLQTLRRLDLDVQEARLADWSAYALADALRPEVVSGDPTQAGQPEVWLMLIAGRTHDWALVQAILSGPLPGTGALVRGISVDRRPLGIRVSNLSNPLAPDGHRQIDLAALRPDRRLSLDDVLAARGYERRYGFNVGLDANAPLPGPRPGMSGDRFELFLLKAVRSALAQPDLRPYVNELWWGVELLEQGKAQALTEFDVLVLACDGSVVHFECKMGPAAGMQRKVFQMRRTFTTESQIALCRKVDRNVRAETLAAKRRSLHEQFHNLGSFGLVLADPSIGPHAAMVGGDPSVLAQVTAILRKAWLPAPLKPRPTGLQQ